MIVYGDTSALIKLVIRQPGTEDMQQLQPEITVLAAAWIAYAELSAAVAAINRDRRLRASQYARARDQIERLWQSTSPIDVDSSLIRHAGQLAGQEALRGYDAVHLAALVRLGPAGTSTLACWDKDLRRAASRLGYAVYPASA